MTNLDWPIGVRFVDLAAGLEAITGIERYPPHSRLREPRPAAARVR